MAVGDWQLTYTAPAGGSTMTVYLIDVVIGESVTIDWGDGSPPEGFSGTNTNVTHAFIEGTYTVEFTGTTHLLQLKIQDQSEVSGGIGDWGQYLPSSLVALHLYNTSVSGDISSWGQYLPSSVESLAFFNTSVSGDISGWGPYLPSSLEYLYLFNTDIVNTRHYDRMLTEWAKHDIPTGVTLRMDDAAYSKGEPAYRRSIIASDYSWTITDAGNTGFRKIDDNTYIKEA